MGIPGDSIGDLNPLKMQQIDLAIFFDICTQK